METKQKQTLEVVREPIRGTRKKDSKLYMIVWERMANSGIHYIWASNETEALSYWDYPVEYVKRTIVEINPLSMPVTIGVQN